MTNSRPVVVGLVAGTLLALGACSSGGSDTPGPQDSPMSDSASAAPSSTAAPSTGKPSATDPEPSGTTATSAPVPAPGRPGTLLDYEAIDENGVLVSRPADTARLTGAPAGFKTYLGRLIEQQSSREVDGCTEAPRISVTQVDTGGWARGSYFIPGCGGAGALWARSGGSWTEAWTGQSLVDCSTLRRFAFPVRIAGDTCDDGSGAVPYKG